MKMNIPGNHNGFCLGSFSPEAIETFKRVMANPFINERLGIKPTYIAPFTKISEGDSLQQFVLLPYEFDSNDEEKKGPKF